MKKVNWFAAIGSLVALLLLVLGLRPIVRMYNILQQQDITYEVATAGVVRSLSDIDVLYDENSFPTTIYTWVSVQGSDNRYKVGAAVDYSRPVAEFPWAYHCVRPGDVVNVIKIDGINKRNFLSSGAPTPELVRQMVIDERWYLIYHRAAWLLAMAAIFGALVAMIFKRKPKNYE